MRGAFFLIALGASGACFAASPVASPTVIDVHLSNFRYSPRAVTLRQGQGYVLRLTNDAKGGHDFTARAFLAAAVVDPKDRGLIEDGSIEVPSGQAREIHFAAPRAGSYPVKCSHTLHKALGMSGQIVVR